MNRAGLHVKANSPLVEPRPVGGLPSVGVFLRDPSPYYASFGENRGKLRTARSTSTTGD